MKCLTFFIVTVFTFTELNADDVRLVEAVVGQSAELPCNVTAIEGDKVSVIAWYKNGSSTAFYSRDFRNEDNAGGTKSGRFRLLSGDDDEDELEIVSVRPSDAGLYTCHVDFESSPTLKTHVQVTVTDPPQRLFVIHENGTRLVTASDGSNSRNIGPYYAGDTVHLFCVAFGGKPQPSLAWWTGKRLLKKTSTPLSEQRVRSDVMYGPLEREDHGRILSCLASNNNFTKPLSIDVIIDMYLSPMLVSVRSPTSKSGVARVMADEPLEAQCRVLGARPPPPIEWRLDDARLANLGQNITTDLSQRLLVSEVQLTLGAEYDESRLTCCVPMYQRDSEEKYLCAPAMPITVRYKPIVQIVVTNNLTNNTIAVVKGSEVTINCSYEANPPVDSLIWYFQNVRTDFDGFAFVGKVSGSVRFTAKKIEETTPPGGETEFAGFSSYNFDDILAKYKGDDVTPALTLPNIAEEHAGEYGCEVSNSAGSTYSTENIIIDVTYPTFCTNTDILEYGLRENEFINITCNATGNPPPTSYRWVLVNDSVTPNTITDETHTTLDTEEPLLLFQRPSGIPFTTIFCWGLNDVPSNGLPHTPCISLITDETAPRPPTDCVAIKSEADLTVVCEKGYDGGLPQQFKFIVKKINKDKYFEDIESITKIDEPTFKTTLPTEEEYKFVIIAFNDKGESGAVEIAMSDVIVEKTETTPGVIPNITTLALALCGGVALIALAACGLVLCAHERGSRIDLPHVINDPPLCAYNTEESNCETYHGSEDDSDCNVRRTESFRRAVSRYPSRNFDVRRTSSFHSARYMNDLADHEAAKYGDSLRHTNCRVHSLQNINKKRDMDMLCDHLVMHLPPEVNYNASTPRPMNTFYTMPRKMRHKLAKELSDETSEITQTSDGFSLPPPPDEYGTYRAGPRIKDMPTKTTPTYTTVLRKNSLKEAAKNPYNNVIISPMNTVGLPTVSGGHNSVYSYPDDDPRGPQNTTGILTTFQSHSSGKESGL